MNYDVMRHKIETTKFLIQRDRLIVPGDLEKEISSLVIQHIIDYKETDEVEMLKSEYDIEMNKVYNELTKYFDNSIILKYEREVLERQIVHQCMQKKKYSTSFCGPQIPWNLNIPIKLDELSYIYIGHEIIHVLKEGRNYEEWIYLLLYSEVLPMLYEFIQTDEKEIQKIAIKWRINELLRMYKNSYNDEVFQKLQNETDMLSYYQMPENIYFISFYYTVLIYSMYKQNPKEVLTEMQNVLNHKVTTKILLNNLGILDRIDSNVFNETYNKLVLKK